MGKGDSGFFFSPLNGPGISCEGQVLGRQIKGLTKLAVWQVGQKPNGSSWPCDTSAAMSTGGA